VIRPKVTETTALGAAFAAGIAVGFWGGEQDVTDIWSEDKRWSPDMAPLERDRLYRNWKKAVTKTMGWVDGDVEN
jgi:glycerol kinase